MYKDSLLSKVRQLVKLVLLQTLSVFQPLSSKSEHIFRTIKAFGHWKSTSIPGWKWLYFSFFSIAGWWQRKESGIIRGSLLLAGDSVWGECDRGSGLLGGMAANRRGIAIRRPALSARARSLHKLSSRVVIKGNASQRHTIYTPPPAQLPPHASPGRSILSQTRLSRNLILFSVKHKA